ncbi:indole-3-glycerol phosphate synthase TrpC [Mechercharimyces sp. CAU 1602]|uniref:indole-3-glycerol phosphate synthase TrpC n=1 Tax=Mechercharimyces sp. CAU 1602 TaxID=2973933 RepID=UPI0021639692|nr:indole-3-glycerol phosphate synthase TrpC [Mechercharimyces sp. CAU 1602]MCS1350588.1 indole-3-glycerol phosphate synthase TrpC [Mechercharimyces sp. CAU 1602]
MFLDRIVQTKKEEIALLREQVELRTDVISPSLPPCYSLKEALSVRGERPAVIAEVKPASPSKGVIRALVDPVNVATSYEKGGAAAISVLTDRPFFHGSLENLKRVKKAVTLPVLRKDFILDEVQIWESRMSGADAILLIAALLSPARLRALTKYAHQLGLEVLLEIHEESEIEAALAAKADVIGINNRDLSTFVTDLNVTERLRLRLPASVTVIGESGIHSRADFDRMAEAGVDGVLIGEYLMRQADPSRALRQLQESVQ